MNFSIPSSFDFTSCGKEAFVILIYFYILHLFTRIHLIMRWILWKMCVWKKIFSQGSFGEFRAGKFRIGAFGEITARKFLVACETSTWKKFKCSWERQREFTNKVNKSLKKIFLLMFFFIVEKNVLGFVIFHILFWLLWLFLDGMKITSFSHFT